MNNQFACFIVFAIWTLFPNAECNDLPPPCSSIIYCHGPLLHTVQMAMIYQDSKTFVDLKLKQSPNETMKLFYKLMDEYTLKPDRFAIEHFVNENFEPAGSEFEDWLPDDWIENPRFLNSNVKDPLLREWGHRLNDLWKFLGRKMKEDVQKHEELYSIIWVPNPVIVPGGRFREFYYWDSYWIIKGLMLSEMHQTAKGMLENMLYIVEKYGFIPNGGRIYYTRRSQPPMLIPMLKDYYDITKDVNFIKENIETLDKEFNFWLNNHTVSVQVDGKNHTLAMYGDKSSGPRPESYREDIETAMMFETKEKRENFYSELKAAAESGWDFSSRWFISNATNKGNLTNLNTRSIIPVDLNSIIYGNAVILAQFYHILNNTTMEIHYKKIAQQWLEAVNAVLWHEDVGAWLDYDIINNVRRNYFYPTNIAPLWTGCYEEHRKEGIVRHVLDYLKKNNITENKGGVPTTHEETGEQWDYPNAWPPLQHLMIVGLDSTGDPYAKALAYELAVTWLRSNYKAFEDTGDMFEKYNAIVFGGHGGGGEYETQLGFGWSNGVILDLLNMYGDRIQVEDTLLKDTEAGDDYDDEDYNSSASSSTFSQIFAGLLVLLVSLITGFIG